VWGRGTGERSNLPDTGLSGPVGRLVFRFRFSGLVDVCGKGVDPRREAKEELCGFRGWWLSIARIGNY